MNDVPRTATGEPQRYILQAEARKAADEFDISLGEGAQWPPDRSYIEDMRMLTRKGRNERPSSNSSKWDQMLGADSFGDLPSISIGSMGGEAFGNASDVFSHSPVKFDDEIDGFVTTRNKNDAKGTAVRREVSFRDQRRGGRAEEEKRKIPKENPGFRIPMDDNNNENIRTMKLLNSDNNEMLEDEIIPKGESILIIWVAILFCLRPSCENTVVYAVTFPYLWYVALHYCLFTKKDIAMDYTVCCFFMSFAFNFPE